MYEVPSLGFHLNTLFSHRFLASFDLALELPAPGYQFLDILVFFGQFVLKGGFLVPKDNGLKFKPSCLLITRD